MSINSDVREFQSVYNGLIAKDLRKAYVLLDFAHTCLFSSKPGDTLVPTIPPRDGFQADLINAMALIKRCADEVEGTP